MTSREQMDQSITKSATIEERHLRLLKQISEKLNVLRQIHEELVELLQIREDVDNLDRRVTALEEKQTGKGEGK